MNEMVRHHFRSRLDGQLARFDFCPVPIGGEEIWMDVVDFENTTGEAPSRRVAEVWCPLLP